MKYIKKFKIFESGSVISGAWDGSDDQESIELLKLLNISTYLYDRGSELKKHIDHNDLEPFKMKIGEIIKHPRIFQGHNQDKSKWSIPELTSGSPDKSYLEPVWPYSLDKLMYILLEWCIEEGTSSFVEYLLDVYDYKSGELDNIIDIVNNNLSKLDDGLFSNHLRSGAEKCIEIIRNRY